MIDVRITNEAICLRAPADLEPVCRAIPGGKWHKPWGCWLYPKSAGSALRLLSDFGAQAASYAALVEMASHASDAVKAKTGSKNLPIPGLKTTPWIHQSRAFQFAMMLYGCMLALGMGCGKSLVSVGLALNRGKHTLILCPKSVVPVWPLEFATHSAKPVTVLALQEGSVERKKKRAEAHFKAMAQQGSRAIVAINYDSAWREPFASWAIKAGFDTLIMDEIHKIKSPTGKRSKFCMRLGKVTPYRIGLTGTPMPHSPLDLFAQFRAIDPSVFGLSWVRHRGRYAKMGGFGGKQVVGYENLPELYSLFDSVALQVGREVIKLPAEKRQVVPVHLGKKAMSILAGLEDDLYAGWETGEITASNVLAKLIRQAQVTGGIARLDDGTSQIVDTAKAEALDDLLDGLPIREPVVVFGRFHEDMNVIKAVVLKQGRSYGELSGRQNDLKAWQDGKIDVLCVQIASGADGINLTRAAYAIYYALDFSLGNFEQSLCRIHRPGQMRPVSFYFLVAPKTIDEKIITALGKRKNVVEHVLSGLPAVRKNAGLCLA